MPRTLTQSAIDAFRERLLKIAAELFVEAGHEGFNMRELARRVGVSPMTPYRYFNDKDEILASICTEAFARLADRLETAQGLPGRAADRIAAAVQAYMDFAEQEPNYYRLMFDFSRPRRQSYRLLEVQQLRVNDAMTNVMRDLIQRESAAGDPELLGQVLWTGMHGAVALNLADQRLFQREKLIKEILRLLFGSYGRGPSADCSCPPSPEEDTLSSGNASRKVQSARPGVDVIAAAE